MCSRAEVGLLDESDGRTRPPLSSPESIRFTTVIASNEEPSHVLNIMNNLEKAREFGRNCRQKGRTYRMSCVMRTTVLCVIFTRRVISMRCCCCIIIFSSLDARRRRRRLTHNIVDGVH